jgi:predicted dehydrogenase
MAAFLDLVAQGKVQPERLVTHRVPIAEAEQAYRIVGGQTSEAYLGILLEYPALAPVHTRVDLPRQPARALDKQVVRLGVVGAGSFARSVLLPKLRRLDVQLRGVATASGPSAQQTAERNGFAFATTDWHQIVDDDDTDAVLVATRHDLHASVAAAALRAGKAVFLEKPMALTNDELDDLLEAWRASGAVLQLGFNRRFAPTFVALQQAFSERREPLVMSYRVNAGAVPSDSWVVDPRQGGGRIIGEACHMLDLMSVLVRGRIVTVHAQPLDSADDVVLSMRFDDGSIGTLVYASGGDRGLPKERLEVLSGGRAAVLDDFRTLELFSGGRKTTPSKSAQDKGHAAELVAFLEAVKSGASPVDPEDAAHVTRVTFAAVESARTGGPVQL